VPGSQQQLCHQVDDLFVVVDNVDLHDIPSAEIASNH